MLPTVWRNVTKTLDEGGDGPQGSVGTPVTDG